MNIFIDTEDMEERYAEGLYQDYLKEQNKHLQQERDKYKSIVEKLKEWLEDENNQKYSQYIYNYSINNWVLNKIKELEDRSVNND